MRYIKLFEDLESWGESPKRDYETISYDEYKEKTARGYCFNINIINKLDTMLVSKGWKAYKSIEHAYDRDGNKFRMVRNFKEEICMTYFPKQTKLLGKWFSRSDKYHNRGVDYEVWDFDKKKIDTIEISSIQTVRIKTDDDDWFYVEFLMGTFDRDYYKCDQWRGLMELLNDINFIHKK